jgi:hypothetical protein
MGENRSSVSGSRSYEEFGEYWDTHSLADNWEGTYAVDFDLDVQSSSRYFSVDRVLAEKLRSLANSHGVSTETLVNLWLQEKVAEETGDAD